MILTLPCWPKVGTNRGGQLRKHPLCHLQDCDVEISGGGVDVVLGVLVYNRGHHEVLATSLVMLVIVVCCLMVSFLLLFLLLLFDDVQCASYDDSPRCACTAVVVFDNHHLFVVCGMVVFVCLFVCLLLFDDVLTSLCLQ